MSEIDERVSRHYGWSGLMETIEEEIRRKGIDPHRVTVDELAPVDNYHWHRLAGTLALARAAAISGADRVLDVGGGIGGPARQLAHRYGCQVTVLDLTEEYCAVGERLTAWTHLEDKVSFVCANALAMPFPDGSFDVVWTQHASMNIADKAGLYGEMARVVRVGGRLAFFDVLAGPHQPIHFPVPWASDSSFNFLQTPDDTRTLIVQCGFREIAWLVGEELEGELARSAPPTDKPSSHPALDPGLLNGPDAPQMGANVGRNSEEGRILPVLGVFERI
jgi:SAM-dependent methyltransferase